MYHIFTIHSPLTFLIAYSVINHLKLDREKVILIASNYKVPIKGFKVAEGYQLLQKKWYQKLSGLNFPKKYDGYLAELTGGAEFVAYVDLMSYYQKIIVTNPLCKEFHFIEEGNSAYMEFDDLNDLTWEDFLGGMTFRSNSLFERSRFRSLIRVLRGYNLRLISLPYHYMAYVNFEKTKFFCFSENAFFNAPPHKKIVVRPDPSSNDINALSQNLVLKDEVIWIDGSNNRYTGLPEVYYHKAIDSAIERLDRMGMLSKRKVFVKLRPGTKEVDSNYLVRSLRNREFQVEVLPDDVVLECLFVVSENCCVIGTLTAALEYAYVFGHEAYSVYGLFERQTPTFLDRMTGFWKNVKKLH